MFNILQLPSFPSSQSGLQVQLTITFIRWRSIKNTLQNMSCMPWNTNQHQLLIHILYFHTIHFEIIHHGFWRECHFILDPFFQCLSLARVNFIMNSEVWGVRRNVCPSSRESRTWEKTLFDSVKVIVLELVVDSSFSLQKCFYFVKKSKSFFQSAIGWWFANCTGRFGMTLRGTRKKDQTWKNSLKGLITSMALKWK